MRQSLFPAPVNNPVSSAPVTHSQISLEEQLLLQEAMQPACRSLLALVRLGYYFRYHTEFFLTLWKEYWGEKAELELEILRVHLREVYFLKPALEKNQSKIQKYLDQLHLLSQMVQTDAAGETRKGWGGDMVYRILRQRYPDEWIWLLHSYMHPEAEQREQELLAKRIIRKEKVSS